ncbi:DUF3040 domain-containing protein [Nonomuraea sp. NPDC000554]|uniref:DUF3040 domain-containing protein n=1 Tax=Nonomuraea sp. NPDC000554 TaxID=3154259 RepID=UPI00331ACE2E
MSLSGKERRILAEIEQALELEDPDLARRVAAINRIEGGDSSPRLYGERIRVWALGHVWVIVLAGVLTVILLILAVATS